MRMNFALALVATLRLATALPVASPVEDLVAREEKREEGIYSYYAKPRNDKEKRDVGIYSYYAKPRNDKDKREMVKERSPQDFADEAPAKE